MEFLENISIDTFPPLNDILIVVVLFFTIWIFQRILTWSLVKLSKRAVRLARDSWEDEISTIIQQPIRYVGIAAGLLLSVELIEVEASLTDFIITLGRSLFIIAIFVALFKAVDIFINARSQINRLTGLSVHTELIPFLQTAIKVIIVSIAIVVVIQEWGYNVTGLVAGLGLGGLAFSLAAQDTVANLFGFTTIVGDRPFNVGEFIVMDDVSGTVEKVGVRSTRIRALDQSLIIVPNAKLADSVVRNWSRLHKRWIELTVGLTYDAQPEDIQAIMHDFEEFLKSREHVQPDTVQVMFSAMNASSLDILVRCYVNLTDWYEWMKEREAIQLAMITMVRDNGQSMAFPSRSLYVENMPEIMHQAVDNRESQLN